MTWRGPRTTRDPLLVNRAWLKVKQHWRTLRIPVCQADRCYLPGQPIGYDLPHTHPRALNVGHIVPRWKAKLLGWTDEQINALSNSRPEHRTCNLKAGARDGQRRQRVRQAARQQLNTSGRW